MVCVEIWRLIIQHQTKRVKFASKNQNHNLHSEMNIAKRVINKLINLETITPAVIVIIRRIVMMMSLTEAFYTQWNTLLITTMTMMIMIPFSRLAQYLGRRKPRQTRLLGYLWSSTQKCLFGIYHGYNKSKRWKFIINHDINLIGDLSSIILRVSKMLFRNSEIPQYLGSKSTITCDPDLGIEKIILIIIRLLIILTSGLTNYNPGSIWSTIRLN